jgi:hypothetical protein
MVGCFAASGRVPGGCLEQTLCCPACDGDPGHVDHDEGEEGPNQPCGRVVHSTHVQGPNWRRGEYDALTGWCGRPECLPHPCPNVLVCRKRWPRWLLDAHGGRCMECNIDFGTNLRFVDGGDEECAICYETGGTHVRLPCCVHTACAACFRRLYYVDNGWARPDGAALLTCHLCRAEYRGPYDPARSH